MSKLPWHFLSGNSSCLKKCHHWLLPSSLDSPLRVKNKYLKCSNSLYFTHILSCMHILLLSEASLSFLSPLPNMSFSYRLSFLLESRSYSLNHNDFQGRTASCLFKDTLVQMSSIKYWSLFFFYLLVTWSKSSLKYTMVLWVMNNPLDVEILDQYFISPIL